MAKYRFKGLDCEHLAECHTGSSLFFVGEIEVDLEVGEEVDTTGLDERLALSLKNRRRQTRRVKALELGMRGICVSDCTHDCGEVEVTGLGVVTYRPIEPRKNGVVCRAPNLLR